MDWQTIAGLIARHILTTAGGALATSGLIDKDAGVQAFVGAGMVLFGIGWSAWQKWGKVLVDAKLAQLHIPTTTRS